MHAWVQEHIRTLTAQTGLSESQARELFLRPIAVELAPQVRGNLTYQLAFTYAINLLSRMFPNVAFEHYGSHPLLILPWGGTRPLVSDAEPAARRLVFGGPVQSESVVVASCHNWHVYIDESIQPDPAEPFNPILSCVTACYAAARITKVLLGEFVAGPSVWRPFSILDFRTATEEFDWAAPLHLDHTHLAGVGAIGSAFLCALLAHGTADGILTLVDHDRLDGPNLGRYSFFQADDVPEFKVGAAKRRIDQANMHLKTEAIRERFETYYDNRYRDNHHFGVRRLVSAPDRRDIRRQFQSKLPRELWDASTGPDQIVLHHNDFNPALACLGCIYPPHPDEQAHWKHVAETLGVPLQRVLSSEPITEQDARAITNNYSHLEAKNLIGRAFESVFRQLCSAGTLRTHGRDVLAPFSFVSGLAGVLLYFEVVKSLRRDVFGKYQQYNYTQINPFYPPNPEFRQLRGSTAKCQCQDPSVRRVFEGLWP